MPETNRMLFEVMRFNILTAALNPVTAKKLSDDYVFAWHMRVYPLFNPGAAEPFDGLFEPNRAELEEVNRFLAEQWNSGKLPTYYQLEDVFQGKHARMSLVSACRYLHIVGTFGGQFLAEPD